jgi:hypothetical protein
VVETKVGEEVIAMGNGGKWNRDTESDRYERSGKSGYGNKGQRPRRDRQSAEEELVALQEEFPGLSTAAIREIIKAGG